MEKKVVIFMTGKEAYNNKYERMSMKRINESNPEWKLNGFYNSLIIKRSYKTSYEYLSYVINFLDNQYVDDVSEIDIDNYYSYMATMKKHSSSGQIGAYHALQKYSKYLKAKGICEDYMQYIERPKFIEEQSTVDKRENGVLTKVETKKILEISKKRSRNSIWSSRDYAIMMIFLSTGIRCSALYKLDINNVDLANKTVIVHEKGNKNRTVNIPDQTVEAIRDWLKYREEILGENNTEKALIISSHRRRMESESIYAIVKKIGNVITGKNITPHKLRATYGTQLYSKTKDLFFVQKSMGHTSPKTTEIYIRGQDAEIAKRASDLIGSFLE